MHAIPQIISTQDVLDAAMMFGFFFLQGVLLLLELLFLKFMRWDKETTLSTNNSSENLSSIANETTAHRHDVLKKVNWQWAAESLLVLAVLTTLYCTLESLFTFETVAAIFFLCIGAVISFCYVQYEIILRKNDLTEWNYSRTDQNIALLKKLMYLVGGWIWVWGSVIAILPLFSVPVVHAFDDMYRNSILIGSLVRASQYILVNYAHLAQADPHTIANSASVANLQSALEHIAAAEL